MANKFAGAALAAMALAVAPAASAQDWDDDWGPSGSRGASANRPGSIQLRVCNRSGQNAMVAVSYIPVGEDRFYNRGWFRIGAGDCNDLVETGNSNFYFYADVEGTNRYWGGNHQLCVEYPGPYNFYSTSSQYCESHQETRGFQPASMDEPGTFTWNLDP